MYDWHILIQTVVDEIDERIMNFDDEALTLESLSKRLGYSEFHTTRKFKEISGMLLGDYIRRRRLAFALIDVRDSKVRLLDIAVKYGFGSHEAFTRAFKNAYGLTPRDYRKSSRPVVLRTKISAFDLYFFGMGENGMIKSPDDVKIYFIKLNAHKFLHVKNYESDGYFDFWEKMDKIPGKDCDTICGLLDSIKEKLDGKDAIIGMNSGQVMANIYEKAGTAEAYGSRLPVNFKGPVPESMLLIDIPESEYIVFEHGPFVYEEESESVGQKIEDAMNAFNYSGTGYKADTSAGRIAYFHFDPESFFKRVLPVVKS
jgi:AraC-like DNA-binding protein